MTGNDRLEVSPSPLSLQPGEALLLKVTGYLNGQKVAFAPGAFHWQVNGNIGTIDGKGIFTAAKRPGAGFIRVSFGSVQTIIEVDVG